MDVRWLGLNRHFLLLSRFEKLGARAASNVVVYPEQGLSYGGLSVDRKRGNQHSEYLSFPVLLPANVASRQNDEEVADSKTIGDGEGSATELRREISGKLSLRILSTA